MGGGGPIGKILRRGSKEEIYRKRPTKGFRKLGQRKRSELERGRRLSL